MSLLNENRRRDSTPTLLSPRLAELFLCLNGYGSVAESRTTCPTLHLLHMTDNQLRDWTEVRKLGAMYPCLSSLVLANNHVTSVDDAGETFPNLRSINLNNSGLTRRSTAPDRRAHRGATHLPSHLYSAQ